MSLDKKEKEEIIKDNTLKEGDTGSPEVQVALLTEKINRFNKHMKTHIHDFGSKRGLLVNIGRRRKLLKYLSKKDPKRYEAILKNKLLSSTI